ncbi:hypothetical protein LEP1GSC166_1460 [Leptospira kirschneri]|nr:hypothetical protein LEP1GSC198_3347 [Leptospira kirschneri str. JB]EMK08936.1 hypothetical protein LEP1GSC166_1460 [Leptospira kirschneri]
MSALSKISALGYDVDRVLNFNTGLVKSNGKNFIKGNAIIKLKVNNLKI